VGHRAQQWYHGLGTKGGAEGRVSKHRDKAQTHLCVNVTSGKKRGCQASLGLYLRHFEERKAWVLLQFSAMEAAAGSVVTRVTDTESNTRSRTAEH
jgi:hypothetical protein